MRFRCAGYLIVIGDLMISVMTWFGFGNTLLSKLTIVIIYEQSVPFSKEK
jgi:hypothetical protein